MENTAGTIEKFCMAGLHLVSIPPINGKPTKKLLTKNWNQPKSPSNPGGYSANADDFSNHNGSNIGLYHAASNTLALDLDNVDLAARVFEDVAGIDLHEWLNDSARVEIKSPKANRGKLLFRVPPDENYGLRQFLHSKEVIFELRTGNCQDVIFGRHPEGGEYRFIGDPANIPKIPDVLLNILQYWDDWKLCFDSALGVEQPVKIAQHKPQKTAKIPGSRNPIEEFNQARRVAEVLKENGYSQRGADRWIRPDSTSKAPGVVILRNCEDGIERAFSHGGDALNDGYAHDAFDCYRLLQCSGDLKKALNWNPDITQHNRRLYQQQQEAKRKEKTQAADRSKKSTSASNAKNLDLLPDGTGLYPEDIEILEAMNRAYAHTLIGGKNVIVGQRNCQVQGSVLTFESPAEFKKKFLHEPLVGSGKPKNRGQAWLEWPGKNFKPGGTGFFPDPKKCPADALNFFRGYQIAPREGDCTPYLDHIRHVICAGHEPSYRYLIGWLAHLFQRPDVKPNVAIVLKSVEGTGKGTLAEPLLRILGPHGNKTNGAYAIAGRFNGTVANRLFIFADEVDLTDKHVADRLKGIISETTVNLERKGLEIEPLPNYCRLIFASNHTRVLNAGIRERRYLVLEPSDEKAQDSEYFKNLWAWIEDNGAAKLLQYLLHVDLSEFDPYKCPQTAPLIAEKLANLSGVNRYFYEEIMKSEPFDGRPRVYAQELVDDFVKWSHENEELKIKKPAARSYVGKMMAKMEIDVLGRPDRGEGKFYELPDRPVLAQQMAKILDIPETEFDL